MIKVFYGCIKLFKSNKKKVLGQSEHRRWEQMVILYDVFDISMPQVSPIKERDNLQTCWILIKKKKNDNYRKKYVSKGEVLW